MIRHFPYSTPACWRTALLLILAVLLSACDLAGASSTSQSVVIGGLFNVSGPMGGLDQEGENGALLAANELNAAGGVNGAPIRFVTKDGKTDPANIEQITDTLLNQDHPSVVVGFGDTDSVLVAGPLTQKAGVPFITYGATSPRLPGTIGNTLFLACFGDNVQAAAGAEYLYDTLRARKVAVLYDKGVEYTRLLEGYFKVRWTALAGADSILSEDTYQFQDRDYSVPIARIKALNPAPDALYIAAMPNDIPMIVKQFRESGLTLPIVGGDGYDTPDLLADGAAANNVYYSTHALVNSDQSSAALKQFSTHYKAAYKSDPSAFSALGYDAVMLAADAVKRAGSADPAKIQAALEATQNFAGLTGTISYSAGNHIPSKDVTILAVNDGKLTLGAELRPKSVPAP